MKERIEGYLEGRVRPEEFFKGKTCIPKHLYDWPDQLRFGPGVHYLVVMRRKLVDSRYKDEDSFKNWLDCQNISDACHYLLTNPRFDLDYGLFHVESNYPSEQFEKESHEIRHWLYHDSPWSRFYENEDYASVEKYGFILNHGLPADVFGSAVKAPKQMVERGGWLLQRWRRLSKLKTEYKLTPAAKFILGLYFDRNFRPSRPLMQSPVSFVSQVQSALDYVLGFDEVVSRCAKTVRDFKCYRGSLTVMYDHHETDITFDKDHILSTDIGKEYCWDKKKAVFGIGLCPTIKTLSLEDKIDRFLEILPEKYRERMITY